MTQCETCQAGTYQPERGQDTCLVCPPSLNSTEGAVVCHAPTSGENFLCCVGQTFLQNFVGCPHKYIIVKLHNFSAVQPPLYFMCLEFSDASKLLI